MYGNTVVSITTVLFGVTLPYLFIPLPSSLSNIYKDPYGRSPPGFPLPWSTGALFSTSVGTSILYQNTSDLLTLVKLHLMTLF